jgi:uncharacterized protein (TIGR02246 family)
MNNSFQLIMFSAFIAGYLQLAGTSPVHANAHPHPRPDSLPYLDQNTYVHHMAIRAHLAGQDRRYKMQMWAEGERRYIFQGGSPRGHVIDVTDPLDPTVIAESAFEGRQIQLAYNESIDKWILMTGAAPPLIRASKEYPHGKYDDPTAYSRVKDYEGLRGVRFYDATDPLNLTLLSEFSTDLGDPARTLQTGGGTHRDYYDGGRYAYLDAAPDDSFANQESPVRVHTHGVMVVDVADPSEPKHVSTWWMPGQRSEETEAYEQWREHGDQHSFTGMHGAFYVPEKSEDGGRYSYSPWGSLGVLIHDLENIEQPRLVGRFQAPYQPGAIAFHAVDPSRVDRGILLAAPEALAPDCNEPYHDTYILDVTDPSQPTALSTLPVPQPPADAPYEDFCQKRGRFGPHNAPHIKAPGNVDPNFTCYTFFNAGLQCYDISDAKKPTIAAYFIPPQGGDLDDPGSYTRNTDNVFIEWDRKLIWVATDTGLYLVTSPQLGEPVLEPMAVTEWTLQGLNEGHDRADDESAIRHVTNEFILRRENNDEAGLRALLTANVDQRLTSGRMRSGRDAVVSGALESTRRTGGKRSIKLESIRFLGADVAIADGSYNSTGRNDGTDLHMQTTMIYVRVDGEWRIDTIRNARLPDPE